MTPRPPNPEPHPNPDPRRDQPSPDDSRAGSAVTPLPTVEQESLLLELIEGGLDDEAEVRAWSELSPLLTNRPDLRRAVLAMRSDRRALTEWPEEATPASVSDRARFAATQHAMATLSRQAAAHYAPPTMADPPMRLREPRRAPRWVPMALAACAGLLVIGALVASLSSAGLFERSPSRGTLADNTGAADTPSDGPTLDAATTAEGPGRSLASADTSDDEMLPPVGEAPTTDVASALPTSAEPSATRRGVLGAVEFSKAVELAARGRLAVRVVLREPERADRSLAALRAWSGKREASRAWRLSEPAPVMLAALLATPATVAPAPGAPVTMADDGLGKKMPTLDPATTPSATLSVMMVDTASSESALRSLRASLEDRLGRVEWLEFAPEPGAAHPPVAPHTESVLWWTQPPSRWSTWTSVPLIIDRW